jgi:hypothetical protein
VIRGIAAAAGEISFLGAAEVSFVKNTVASHIRAENDGHTRRHRFKRGAR